VFRETATEVIFSAIPEVVIVAVVDGAIVAMM
jgi:hypothetical protein